MSKGFIMLEKSYLEDPLYLSERFTRSQAFLDLCFNANYKDNFVIVRGNKVTLKQGQLAISLRDLAVRWKWSVNTVKRYISDLESGGYVDTQKTSVNQIITIKKYIVFNTQVDTHIDTHIDTQADTQNDTHYIANNNNNNNIKKEEDNNREANASMSSGDDAPKNPEFDYGKFLEFFNKTIEENGSVIPQIKKIETRRRSKIHARIEDYGENAVYEVVTKAAKSKFLNGGGNKGWTAHFDWLFGPDNFRKVLEGNYDNGTIRHGSNTSNNGLLVGQLLTDSKEERDRKFKGATGWR